jgi:hypothetical protein
MRKKLKNHLKGARVYLSGPMDFVASRAAEKKYGWRTRVSQFLRSYGVTVFDPWNKPQIRGLHEYGREDVKSIEVRDKWTFDPGKKGVEARGECAASFWETMHIDLRMVDVCDFLIAYCPTNIYSVGTVHEIVVARQERKPVLFVSPPATFPTLKELEKELEGHKKASRLLEKLKSELPIKENEKGIPSLWYMPLVGTESFFDGFGFNNARYRRKFTWSDRLELDERELRDAPERPLLQYLEDIAMGNYLRKWEPRSQKLIPNDDWLLMEQTLASSEVFESSLVKRW